MVYAEEHRDVRDAIAREKTLKGWTRARKVALIETANPDWLDLAHAAARWTWPGDGYWTPDARRRRLQRLFLVPPTAT